MTDLSALAAAVSALVVRYDARDRQWQDWLAGTITGGPGGDGAYPLDDAAGTTHLVLCPAAWQASRGNLVFPLGIPAGGTGAPTPAAALAALGAAAADLSNVSAALLIAKIAGAGFVTADQATALANAAALAEADAIIAAASDAAILAKGRGAGLSAITPAPVLAIYAAGRPDAGECLLRFVAPLPLSLPAGLTGSCAIATTPAATIATLTVAINGAAVGTLTIAAGAGTASPGGAGGLLSAGDVLSITAPSPADLDLADIACSLLLERIA